MDRAAGGVHAPTPECDEEQHIQSLEPDRVDREEIDRHQTTRLRSNKLAPRRTTARRRSHVSGTQHIPDGCRRDRDPKSFQFANNALVAPSRVLAGQTPNQLAKITANRPTSNWSRVRPAPCHEPTM